MPFDGTTFRGLDDNAVSDGVNLDDQPVDVFLEQSIASNSRYLHTGFDAASVPHYGLDSDLTPNANERVFCSRNLSRTHFFPVVLSRGDTSIDVDFMLEQTAEDTGGTNVDFELRLVEWNAPRVGQGRRLATHTFSVTTTSGYEAVSETIELPGPQNGEKLAFLEVWQQGDSVADTGSNLTASTITANGFSTSTDITSLETYRTMHLVSDTTGVEYDIVALGDRNAYLFPRPAEEEDGAVFSVYETQYTRIRGISLRVNSNGLVASQAPTPQELVAQRSVRANTTLVQGASVNSCYARARHIGFGPAGEASPEETSGQPWYLWKLAPVSEVHIDGVLQDAITGNDQFLCVVCWVPSQYNMKIDTTVSMSARVLDAGDTDWDDGTVVASGSQRASYSVAEVVDGRDFMQPVNTFAREYESADFVLLREGHCWPGEINNIMTTIVPCTIASDFDGSRHSRPFRVQFTFTTNETPYLSSPRYYVCGYSIVGVGRYSEGSP